jgi:5'-3' exonuclease
VRATFAALDLPWTAATALRVLAHDESAPPPGPRPQLETGWGHRPARPRLPARPVSNQLTLF